MSVFLSRVDVGVLRVKITLLNGQNGQNGSPGVSDAPDPVLAHWSWKDMILRHSLSMIVGNWLGHLCGCGAIGLV